MFSARRPCESGAQRLASAKALDSCFAGMTAQHTAPTEFRMAVSHASSPRVPTRPRPTNNASNSTARSKRQAARAPTTCRASFGAGGSTLAYTLKPCGTCARRMCSTPPRTFPASVAPARNCANCCGCTRRWVAADRRPSRRPAFGHGADGRTALRIRSNRLHPRRNTATISTSRSRPIRKPIRQAGDALADLRNFRTCRGRRRRRDHPVLLQHRRVLPLCRRRARSASRCRSCPGSAPISNFSHSSASPKALRRRDPALDRPAHARLRRRRGRDPGIRLGFHRADVERLVGRRARAALLHAQPVQADAGGAATTRRARVRNHTASTAPRQD